MYFVAVEEPDIKNWKKSSKKSYRQILLTPLCTKTDIAQQQLRAAVRNFVDVFRSYRRARYEELKEIEQEIVPADIIDPSVYQNWYSSTTAARSRSKLRRCIW